MTVSNMTAWCDSAGCDRTFESTTNKIIECAGQMISEGWGVDVVNNVTLCRDHINNEIEVAR